MTSRNRFGITIQGVLSAEELFEKKLQERIAKAQSTKRLALLEQEALRAEKEAREEVARVEALRREVEEPSRPVRPVRSARPAPDPEEAEERKEVEPSNDRMVVVDRKEIIDGGKIRYVNIEVEEFVLQQDHFKAIADQTLELCAENRGRANQVRIYFGSTVNEGFATDITFTSLPTREQIMEQLASLLDRKIAVNSEGEWVITHFQFVGTI